MLEFGLLAVFPCLLGRAGEISSKSEPKQTLGGLFCWKQILKHGARPLKNNDAGIADEKEEERKKDLANFSQLPPS